MSKLDRTTHGPRRLWGGWVQRQLDRAAPRRGQLPGAVTGGTRPDSWPLPQAALDAIATKQGESAHPTFKNAPEDVLVRARAPWRAPACATWRAPHLPPRARLRIGPEVCAYAHAGLVQVAVRKKLAEHTYAHYVD